METCYQISEKVAHQMIDGEVIVIHFDSGTYYSLSGTAAELWQMLQRPQNLESLSRRFISDNGEVTQAVGGFLGQLRREGLVERAAGTSASANGAQPLVFETPVLEKYSDMQQLLQADPMHDVEEDGWPKVKS
jgi:hypothetical protein